MGKRRHKEKDTRRENYLQGDEAKRRSKCRSNKAGELEKKKRTVPTLLVYSLHSHQRGKNLCTQAQYYYLLRQQSIHASKMCIYLNMKNDILFS
uniref:Uncharacterized protein n=1 Tax=Lepeophtheirus salmonis TaxID=72036 RepID=A0A0K2TXV7_LEPSM